MSNNTPARPGINTVKKMRERMDYLVNLVNERDKQIEGLYAHMDSLKVLLEKREEQGQGIRDALSPGYSHLPLEEAVVENLEYHATRAMNAIQRAQHAEEERDGIRAECESALLNLASKQQERFKKYRNDVVCVACVASAIVAVLAYLAGVLSK